MSNKNVSSWFISLGLSILLVTLVFGACLLNPENVIAAFADHDEDAPVGGSRSGGIAVGIYNHGSTGDISYWTGGNLNSYSEYKSILDNDPESRFTTKTITSLSSTTLNTIDVLLLPDNCVPNSELSNVKNWFKPGKGIIGADSAACYLVYSGFLIPGYSGGNGENTYWDYSSNSGDQKILINHKITEDYVVNNSYSSVSGDVQYYKNKLPANAICLSACSSDNTKIYIVARDVPSYGRLVGLGPFDSPPTGLDELIRDAVEWSAKEYRVGITPNQQSEFGAANDIVDYTFTIENQGSKNDTYDLDVLGNTLPTKIFDTTASTEISNIFIVAHNNKDIIIRVTVPSSADYQDTDLAVLKVTSQTNCTVNETATMTTIISHNNPWSDDFETGKLSNNWTINGSVNNAGVNKKTANSGYYSMYTSGDSVSITSPPIDTRGLDLLEVSFWVRRGGYFSEIPDDNEDLVVE